MDVYFTLRGAPLAELRSNVQWVEQVGARGVLLPDHLFTGDIGSDRSQVRRGSDPLVLLGAIAAMSDRLTLGTSVSNIGLLHPALVIRQFAQLAALVGGERVLAGLGAGWNRGEFEALGMSMPPFAQRMDRLEESARLARELFDHGMASLEGSQVVARDLPLGPLPERPPRLMIGGGSDRVLDIAGKYADALDLNGTSQAGALRGRNLAQADAQRRLSTTVDALADSARRLSEVATAAGRAPDAVRVSTLMSQIIFCREEERAAEAERLTTAAGLEPGSLDACPYVLLGEPARMIEALHERQERFGLRALLIMSTLPRPTAERLMNDVVSHL
jgi:alkanesulfonate monooxygenase SsuD/methylene tetrahydromethanopterin reductase-like flavin-dependent oxidoreductase (luciferase family)